uniref:Uncharacterized protein n=1 Tax=Mustela putorius furo TaxID=9669 RepID=M3Y431_MUSPF
TRLPSPSGQTFHPSRLVSSFVKRGCCREVCRTEPPPLGSIPAAALPKPPPRRVAARGFKERGPGVWTAGEGRSVHVCVCVGGQTPSAALNSAGRKSSLHLGFFFREAGIPDRPHLAGGRLRGQRGARPRRSGTPGSARFRAREPARHHVGLGAGAEARAEPRLGGSRPARASAAGAPAEVRAPVAADLDEEPEPEGCLLPKLHQPRSFLVNLGGLRTTRLPESTPLSSLPRVGILSCQEPAGELQRQESPNEEKDHLSLPLTWG